MAAKPRSAHMHAGPGFRVRMNIERLPLELMQGFTQFATPDISDLLNRLYAVDPQIRCLTSPNHRVCGPALTVKVFPGDNLMVHKSLDVLEPGDVVIVDAGGSHMNAVLGDLISTKARHRGAQGFVIDGLIRDLPGIQEIDLPVFARGTSPIGPLHRGPGEINFPICCGGVVVNPGDLIVGDAMGVVVVPHAIAADLLQRLQAHESANASYFDSVKKGNFSNAWVDNILGDLGCPIVRGPSPAATTPEAAKTTEGSTLYVMPKFLTNPLVLRGLYAVALAKAFLRYRNPRRRKSGRHHAAFYERTWREAAEALGGTWTLLAPGIGEMNFPDGSRTRVDGSVSEIDDPVTLAVAHDKPLTHRLLREQGLVVPRHAPFSLGDVTPAVGFLRATERDCVVKPAGGTGGGRGVTTGIRTVAHLARAAAAAAVYGDDLMIEEQITGDNYRLLYLDGQLLDAFVRRLPTVTGDGRSSVAQLVQRANDERLRQGTGISQVLLTVDLDMRRTLAKQGLSLRSVPESGRTVTLKTVVNENAGADNTTVTHQLHPSIVEDAARAARTVGLRFAGIDLVTPDPTVPLAQSGGVILEVNGTPNLYYHYHKADSSFPVATHLLRRLLDIAPPAPERPHSTASISHTQPEPAHA